MGGLAFTIATGEEQPQRCSVQWFALIDALLGTCSGPWQQRGRGQHKRASRQCLCDTHAAATANIIHFFYCTCWVYPQCRVLWPQSHASFRRLGWLCHSGGLSGCDWRSSGTTATVTATVTVIVTATVIVTVTATCVTAVIKHSSHRSCSFGSIVIHVGAVLWLML